MPALIALLRSVNVSGHRKVPMAELRQIAQGLGHTQVATYITSGNLVFRSAAASPEAAAAGLEQALGAAFGIAIPVIVRTPDELAAATVDPPFPTTEGNRLFVTFLRDAPVSDAGLDPNRSPPDRYHLRGRDLYLHCPNGAGETKYTLDYLEKKLGTVGTARNWNTLLKLLEMGRAIDQS